MCISWILVIMKSYYLLHHGFCLPLDFFKTFQAKSLRVIQKVSALSNQIKHYQTKSNIIKPLSKPYIKISIQTITFSNIFSTFLTLPGCTLQFIVWHHQKYISNPSSNHKQPSFSSQNAKHPGCNIQVQRLGIKN